MWRPPGSLTQEYGFNATNWYNCQLTLLFVATWSSWTASPIHFIPSSRLSVMTAVEVSYHSAPDAPSRCCRSDCQCALPVCLPVRHKYSQEHTQPQDTPMFPSLSGTRYAACAIHESPWSHIIAFGASAQVPHTAPQLSAASSPPQPECS